MNEQTEPGIGKLALALSKAQGMIKGATKDSENPHFKSKYADLASVWDACREALAKNEIAVIQPVSGGPDTITITTILAHSSGEVVREAFTIRPGKADAQGLGSAITYGRRYGLAAMVGVAPEDDDGNAASEGAKKTEAKAKEIDRAKAATPDAPKTNGLWLNDGGAGSTHGSVSAYLDALDRLLSRADDPAAMFDLNAALLQEQQAKAVTQAKTNPKAQAIVGRIKAIFDHVHAGTVPGKQAAE